MSHPVPVAHPDRPIARWIAELGPLTVYVLVVWVKFLYVGLLLPSVSWSGGEPLHLLPALSAYPDMFSATLACLLLPVPLLMVAAAWYLFITSLLMVGQYFLERHYGRGHDIVVTKGGHM